MGNMEMGNLVGEGDRQSQSDSVVIHGGDQHYSRANRRTQADGTN